MHNSTSKSNLILQKIAVEIGNKTSWLSRSHKGVGESSLQDQPAVLGDVKLLV